MKQITIKVESTEQVKAITDALRDKANEAELNDEKHYVLSEFNIDVEEVPVGRKEEAEQAARNFMRWVNGMSSSKESFADVVCNDHRTLQQSAFSTFSECIKRWAETEHFDARNEDTVKQCREIVKVENFGYTSFI